MTDEPGIENDHWIDWQWQGAYCRIWRGNAGDSFNEYTKIYEGSAGAIERDGPVAKLPLLSIDHLVDRNLLTKEYLGTDPAGGSEGPSGLRGTLKPFAAGYCKSVEPILVDRVNNIYQVHGYGAVKSIDAVYENAFSLGPPSAIASTWAELAALKLADGQWAAAPAIGAFRVKNVINGKPSADVSGAMDGAVYPETTGAILSLLIKTAGLSASKIAPTLAARAEKWRLFTSDQTTIGEQLRSALLASGCAAVPTSDGSYAALDYFDLKAPMRLNGANDTFPIVTGHRLLNVAPPVWQVRVQGDRCWSVHTEAEVSQALAQLSADAEANNERIRLAVEALEKAKAQAEYDAKIIEEILSDGILDRGEKAQQIARFESESAQRVELLASSERYAVEGVRNAYIDAFATLKAYLDSLVPAFTDLTKATPIDATYAAVWKAYDLAKIKLLNAMTGDIKTITDDTKVIVDKVVEDVDKAQADIEAAKAALELARKTLPDRLNALIAKPIEQISALQLKGSTANLVASKALSDKNALAITKLDTRITDDGAVVSEQITQLTSRVKKGEDTVEAGFLQTNRTIADTKQALAESIVLTIAKYGESASAAMVEERRVRATKDDSIVESILQMSADFTNELGDKLTGQYNEIVKIIADGDEAVGTKVEELGVKLVEDVAGEKLAREAAIQTIEKTIVDTDGASAKRIDSLSSSFDSLNRYVGDVAGSVEGVNGRVDAVYSVIQTVQDTAADANGARAEETRNLKAQLDGMNFAQLEQSLSTYATKLDGIGAQYTLKVQTTTNGVPVVAGMGIAVEDGVSAVSFLADSFNIAVPGAVAPTQVFKADAEGIYMPNVRADNIKAGAIDFEFINKQSLLDPNGGYQMLPGGLIIMWGRYRQTIRSEIVISVNFPMAFPSVCLSFQATPYLNVFNNERDLWVQIIGQPTQYGASVATQAARRDDQYLDGFDWIAFGR